MKLKLDLSSKELRQISDKVADYTLSMDFTWDWPGGVGYYGVSRLFEVTGDRIYLDKMIAWCDEYISEGTPEWTVNACAIGHMVLTLYEHTKEQKYYDLVWSKIDYLENKALRFGDRVLQHTVSPKNDFPEQCWADTLFMAAYFMIRVGVTFNEKRLIEDGLHQFFWHINYLQDEENALWYHGYDNIKKNHMSGIHWARGNAWAAYTMSRVATIIPEAYLYPPMMHIWSSVRDQLAALKKLQKEDGLWGTVLDYEGAYSEVSASAGIAAAMVTQGNPLHAKYVRQAIKGILANVAANGKVNNVSGGTAVMNNIEGYLGIDHKWAQGWGQGLVLAFLSSVIEKVEQEEQGQSTQKKKHKEVQQEEQKI